MRLRNIKGAKEYLETSPYVIQNPSDFKGKWSELFNNTNPIHIEIGMGKGQFIHALSRQNPNINYIGIEMYSSVLFRAVQQHEIENDLTNLYFIRFDAKEICDIFEENEIDKIYLNFSDPWPKDRHAKRRLTSPNFLEKYDIILAPSGTIQFKTDNRMLFDFSVESANESPIWNITEITYDLHNSKFVNGNIMTEYETKFVAEGKPINRFVLAR